ncbi:MAG: cell wall-binding repeat-containing protein [Tissierellia bacterium]|nr:cell wall-binding repeat-containing protein [Tissierellia bacterium]
MKKSLRRIFSLALVLSFLIPSLALADDAQKYERISGENRYETSVEVSQEAFDKSDDVIVASGENFPDALAGGQLALAMKAPILLTKANELPYVVKEEIRRLDAKSIFVLGGENTVGEAVEKELAELAKVERISGNDRYETSKLILEKTKELGKYEKLVIVSGAVYPDALTASSYIMKNNALLLLSDGNSVPETDLELIAVGGEKTLALPKFEGKRISGENRYETALELAKEAFDKAEKIIIASGENYPDALTAISLAAKEDAAILLSPSKAMNAKVLENYKGKDIKVIVVGGVNSVNDAAVEEIFAKDPVKPDPEKPEEPTLDEVKATLTEYIESIQWEKLKKAADHEGDTRYDIPPMGKALGELNKAVNRAKELLNKEELSAEEEKELRDLTPHYNKKGKAKEGLATYVKNFVVNWHVQGERTVFNSDKSRQYTELKDNKIVVHSYSVKKLANEDINAYINYVVKDNYDPDIDTVSGSTPKYKKDKLPAEHFTVNIDKQKGIVTFTINDSAETKEFMKDIVILKPIIKVEVAKGSRVENGDLVFIKDTVE